MDEGWERTGNTERENISIGNAEALEIQESAKKKQQARKLDKKSLNLNLLIVLSYQMK